MIYIDIDGVLTLFASTVNKVCGTNITRINSYGLDDFKSPTKQKDLEKVKNTFADPILYIESCMANWNLITKIRPFTDKFCILTARREENSEHTKKWLKFVGLGDVQVFHQVNKHEFLLPEDVLIDDCVKNVTLCLASNRNAVLYENPECIFKKEKKEFGITKKNIVNDLEVELLLKGV